MKILDLNFERMTTRMPMVLFFFSLHSNQRAMIGNGFFSIPEHTPLIFTESSGTGRTLFRLLVSDASGENEGYLLAETVPFWAVDVTVKVGTRTKARSVVESSLFTIL